MTETKEGPLILEKTTIYVLALEQSKYYIGATTQPEIRLDSHFSAKGSAWTLKYKPLRVIHQFEGDIFDEDKLTKAYMHQHGIENVRGASYVKVALTKKQTEAIKAEFVTIDNACFKCNKRGHYASNCPGINAKPSADEAEEEAIDDMTKKLANTHLKEQK